MDIDDDASKTIKRGQRPYVLVRASLYHSPRPMTEPFCQDSRHDPFDWPMRSFCNSWSFRFQRFLFPKRVLFALSADRFVFRAKLGGCLCGFRYVDFGHKQWAFCVTHMLVAEGQNTLGGITLASELRGHVLAHGAKECLVLFSPTGWPKDAFLLQKDGIIWDQSGVQQP